MPAEPFPGERPPRPKDGAESRPGDSPRFRQSCSSGFPRRIRGCRPDPPGRGRLPLETAMPMLRALSGIAFLALSLSTTAIAQAPDSSLLTVERIFGSGEFAADPLGDVRWIPGSAAYTRLEPDSAQRGATALVRYDAATGRREVWVPAARLVPTGDSIPLDIEDYALSPDR